MNIQLDSNVLHTVPYPPANWVDFFGFQLPSVQAGRNITLTLQGGREVLVVCELVIYGGKIVWAFLSAFRGFFMNHTMAKRGLMHHHNI